MLSQLFLLFLCEVLLITRLSFKWKRVEWVLRMFLMEYIILTIFPIWECLRVSTLSNYRFLFSVGSFRTSLLWLHLKIFICVVAGSSSFHFMRVDNFRFFFEIKCFAFFENNCAAKFFLKILLISRAQALWIWISDKFVGTSSLTSTLITCESS